MADFNISENYEEEIKTEKRRNKLIPIVIVVVSALFVGLIVFLISTLIISSNKEKKEKEKEPEITKVTLSDPTVKKLYKSVTYEAGPKYYNKFIKEESVTLDTFNNREKYYYALQFAKSSDFIDTNNKDENNKKVYLLPEDKLKHYMREFFGNSVTYNQNEVIVCEFSFDMPEGNLGSLKYLNNSSGYNTTFTSSEGTAVPTKNHYSKLVSAKKNGTELILKEKIVYINIINNNNLYDIEIYNDYNKTRLLETIKNVSDLDNAVDIENYLDRASTITYTFKESKNNYYFVSSKITN